MNAQYIYNEKRLGSLKAASQPKADELRRMEELDGIISSEQAELDRLTKCSSKLKDKVSAYTLGNISISRPYLLTLCLFPSHLHSLCFSVVTIKGANSPSSGLFCLKYF